MELNNKYEQIIEAAKKKANILYKDSIFDEEYCDWLSPDELSDDELFDNDRYHYHSAQGERDIFMKGVEFVLNMYEDLKQE